MYSNTLKKNWDKPSCSCLDKERSHNCEQHVAVWTRTMWAQEVLGRAMRKWKEGGFTHRLVGADGVNLSPKHDGREDQKEKTLEAEED